MTSALVEMPNEAGVRAYLEQHPDLSEAVPAACRAARDEFGPSAQLRLETYRDPECSDTSLILRLRLPEYPADVLPRLRSVGDRYEHLLPDTTGSLFVTTDFGPAR